MITAPHLHAMVIHFPITLLMAGFLSELIAFFSKKQFFKNASFYLLILGTLGAIVAYVSGNYAGDGMTDGILQTPMENHEEAALVTLGLAIITSIFRGAIQYFDFQKAWAQWTILLLFTALAVSVSITGNLGGQLVFKHGAGIELTLPDFGDSTME
jgi:uncharacterized membrane protein